MVQIIGRLTSDATVKNIGDKEVVNFTIAINDYYKPKGAAKAVEQVTFVQCGYWLNTAIAATLRKGAIVEAGGRLFATAYMKDNEPNGQVNMQVQHIKVHAFAKKDEQQAVAQPEVQGAEQAATNAGASKSRSSNKAKNKQKVVQAEIAGPNDDLPF